MNERTIELKTILRSTRQRGSTTYLLDAAINNPNVTIIVANQTQAKQLEEQYKEKVNSLPWWKKALRKISKSGEPNFVSMKSYRELDHAKKTPVMIDLHAVASAL